MKKQYSQNPQIVIIISEQLQRTGLTAYHDWLIDIELVDHSYKHWNKPNQKWQKEIMMLLNEGPLGHYGHSIFIVRHLNDHLFSDEMQAASLVRRINEVRDRSQIISILNDIFAVNFS